MAERHTIETYGTQPNNRNIWSTATECHTIETYGPQPNNRNIWQTGWRHAWPILLSVLVAAFIPLLPSPCPQVSAFEICSKEAHKYKIVIHLKRFATQSIIWAGTKAYIRLTLMVRLLIT